MTHTENETEEAERRVSGQCPFCNAKIQNDFPNVVFYVCGSYANRQTGEHTQRCITPIITTHWGPM